VTFEAPYPFGFQSFLANKVPAPISLHKNQWIGQAHHRPLNRAQVRKQSMTPMTFHDILQKQKLCNPINHPKIRIGCGQTC
jgi:hypothetical protein